MPELERHHTLGSGGYCICPKCETRVPHHDGVRCMDERCPRCGAKMLREGSEHHQLWSAKRAQQAAKSRPAPGDTPPGPPATR